MNNLSSFVLMLALIPRNSRTLHIYVLWVTFSNLKIEHEFGKPLLQMIQKCFSSAVMRVDLHYHLSRMQLIFLHSSGSVYLSDCNMIAHYSSLNSLHLVFDHLIQSLALHTIYKMHASVTSVTVILANYLRWSVTTYQKSLNDIRNVIPETLT